MNVSATSAGVQPEQKAKDAGIDAGIKGQREVFCGLTSIVWLHRKISDAFFLVVGSRTCAHLLQSAAGVMIFAEPRFATAILGEKDLAGLADANDELDRIVGEILTRRPTIKMLFLVGSCPSEVIKLDLGKSAERLNSIHRDVHILNYSGSGIETTFTDGEDRCLEALIAACPDSHPDGRIDNHSASTEAAHTNGYTPTARTAFRPAGPDQTKPFTRLLILGNLADIVEDQFRRLFTEFGVKHVDVLPPRNPDDLPPIGPGTVVLPAQPYLTQSIASLERRGAHIISCVMPLGVEGTRLWIEAALLALGIRLTANIRARLDSLEERGKRGLNHLRPHLAGKTIAFLPDSQLEIPLARMLSRELGMIPTTVISPYVNKHSMGAELALLPDGVSIFEKGHVDAQVDHILDTRPDMVVCGLGLANPFEAKGLLTKWSIELLFTPIQGFDQASDLAGLFTRPLDRRERLVV